jgi:hypothetical protein
MTTKPKRKARAKITTLKKAAALDFEPWQYDPAFKAPTLEQIRDPHLILCLMAYGIMHRSKPELAQSFADGATTILPWIDRLEESRRFFMGAAKLIEAARARLIVAGSSFTEATR